MLFRRIIFSALLVGLLSGLLFTVVQSLSVSPIIFAAEQYEVAEPVVESALSGAHEHHHGGHEHNEEAWGPEDGLERFSYTLLSNVLAGIGFAAVLLSIMSQFQIQGLAKLSPAKGLLWGVAGFIAFFAAPGIGLPPEIPGIEAAPLEHRQLWWVLTVLASAVGLALIAFANGGYKAIGLVIIALPFMIGAPHPTGPEFSHPDASAVAILQDLHHQFILASSAANLVFWLAIGALSALALKRFVLKQTYA